MVAISHMEVRIIHLARASERRALMEVELARAGVAVDGWAAVDGRDPANAARVAAVPDTGPWCVMDPHAKGCLLSHLDAIEAFLAGTSSHLMVLEDDIFIAEDLGQWLSGDWWPEDANIVKLERWRDDRLLVLTDRAQRHHAGRAMQRIRTKHSGGAGYILDRATAARVLKDGRRDLPIDHILFNPTVSDLAARLTIYQVIPALVQQGNEPARASHPGATPRRKPFSENLRRAFAEARVLRQLPHLLNGTARLMAVGWQGRADASQPQSETLKG